MNVYQEYIEEMSYNKKVGLGLLGGAVAGGLTGGVASFALGIPHIAGPAAVIGLNLGAYFAGKGDENQKVKALGCDNISDELERTKCITSKLDILYNKTYEMYKSEKDPDKKLDIKSKCEEIKKDKTAYNLRISFLRSRAALKRKYIG